MQNLIRPGNAWFARYFVPKDRWADAGRATDAAGGIKREVVRTLATTDRALAKRRLAKALGAIEAELDVRLQVAGLPPLTDWTADWPSRVRALRATLQGADDTTAVVSECIVEDGELVEIGPTERDLMVQQVGVEAECLEQVRGYAAAKTFFEAVTTENLTLREGLDTWLAEASRGITQKTAQGHRKVFADLDRWLRDNHNGSIDTLTLSGISRRIAGEFIAYRRSRVSADAVKREASAPMGLWRWAVRRGHIEINPWTDQTAGLSRDRRKDDDAKRAFSAVELVSLLRATGGAWAPNGGGYGATLWDAVRLALLTGLRARELADLRVCDLTADKTVIRVRHGKTANASRHVPLPQGAQEVLKLRLRDLPDTSPDAPLWPELPVLTLTGSRGNKLSDRFRMARERILPGVQGVDFHSLRRSYATALEAAMHAQGRINPTTIATLMGHQRGTLALDRYSAGAALDVLRRAVEDVEALGFAPEVRQVLSETMQQRPRMGRFAPVNVHTVARP